MFYVPVIELLMFSFFLSKACQTTLHTDVLGEGVETRFDGSVEDIDVVVPRRDMFASKCSVMFRFKTRVATKRTRHIRSSSSSVEFVDIVVVVIFVVVGSTQST